MIQMQFDASRMEVKLGGLYSALADLRPLWPEVHIIFQEFMSRVFRTQGAYGGQRWAPLNPSYAAWKTKNFGARPIMQLTGELSRSFTDPGHSGHVYRTGPSFMETGTKIKYARTHQWGYAQRNIPPRPLIRDFTKQEGERAADAALAYMLRAMRTGGAARHA
jgi:phage gpG-like protein